VKPRPFLLQSLLVQAVRNKELRNARQATGEEFHEHHQTKQEQVAPSKNS